MLKPNGVLIIEDIQDIQHVDALTSALPEELQQCVQIFDNRSSRGRYDDIIWAIVNPAS